MGPRWEEVEWASWCINNKGDTSYYSGVVHSTCSVGGVDGWVIWPPETPYSTARLIELANTAMVFPDREAAKLYFLLAVWKERNDSQVDQQP